VYWVSNARAARLDFGKHKMVQGGKYPSLLQIGTFSFCRATVGAEDCVVVRKTATQGIFASYFLDAAFFT